MKIPKSVMINGKAWKVEHKWGLLHQEVLVNGLCDFDSRTIFLRRELKKEAKPKVYLHELIHAILWESHVSSNFDWVPSLVEDIICDSITTNFDHLFKWTPKKG